VNACRRLVLTRGRLVLLLCVVALAVRFLVPAGYMLTGESGRIAVTLCPETIAAPTMAMPGDDHGDGERHAAKKQGATKHGRAEMPCPFASLAAPAFGAADPLVPAVAPAVVAALALAAFTVRPVRLAVRLRPPLRAPPARS
jgi:hypothetical protein